MSDEPNLDRRRVVAELLRDRGDLLVVSGLGAPTYDVMAAGDHDLNFYLWGAMGSAAMLGLGLAAARPDRPVLVLTGDGEQLMGLGALATVAVRKPRNLSVVVLDNGRYGETGMQVSHSGYGLELSRVAEGCGFSAAARITRETELAALRRRIHGGEGPTFATVKVEAVNLPRVLPSRDGVFLKTRFRQALLQRP